MLFTFSLHTRLRISIIFSSVMYFDIYGVKLEDRNLQINESKMEKCYIEQKGNEAWKECKILGSLLDTEKDINRRKL